MAKLTRALEPRTSSHIQLGTWSPRIIRETPFFWLTHFVIAVPVKFAAETLERFDMHVMEKGPRKYVQDFKMANEYFRFMKLGNWSKAVSCWGLRCGCGAAFRGSFFDNFRTLRMVVIPTPVLALHSQALILWFL
ncbi:MAG: hypothetical protein Q9225_007491 [Loekoesia sp. 1 TL-2023]